MKAFILALAVLACASALPARKSESAEFFDKFFGPGLFGDDGSDSVDAEDSSEITPMVSPFLFPFRIVPVFPSIFRDVSIPTTDSGTKLTNSTSETKFIHGKKVVVNNTYYENPKTGSVLTIKTVRINLDKDRKPSHPDKEDPIIDEVLTEIETETAPAKERDTDENEIREPLGEDSAKDDLLA